MKPSPSGRSRTGFRRMTSGIIFRWLIETERFRTDSDLKLKKLTRKLLKLFGNVCRVLTGVLHRQLASMKEEIINLPRRCFRRTFPEHTLLSKLSGKTSRLVFFRQNNLRRQEKFVLSSNKQPNRLSRTSGEALRSFERQDSPRSLWTSRKLAC